MGVLGNVGVTAQAEGSKTDKPVKLFVVRIKPRGKPLVQEVPAPQ